MLLRKVCHQLVEMLCFVERKRLFFNLVAQLFQARAWWKSWTEAPAVAFGHTAHWPRVVVGDDNN